MTSYPFPFASKSLACAGLALAAGAFASSDAPLNLMLIIADDMTYRDASVYGGQARTPHMDSLAKEGMRFERCFQAAPMCSPTRHALYTGLYPVRSGAMPNHTFVYDGVRSIAHYLQEAGYRAGFSGKTHINPPEAFPFELLPGGKKIPNPDFAAVDGFLAECAAAGSPFGLILCSNEPHTPYTKGDPSAYPPESLTLPPIYGDTPATRSEFSKYLAEITYFDGQVGEALALLEKHGLAGNTLVVVLTEQGNSFPFAKWTCYDVGLRSGLIVRWPGVVQEGSTSDALVEYIDVLPTFFEAAGMPPIKDIDGVSFAQLLRGKTRTHKRQVFGLQSSVGIINGPPHYGIRSVRDERYRYILNLTPEITFTNWATDSKGAKWWGEWETAAANGDPVAAKAVRRYQHRPAEELYDCQEDPWNEKNLADDPEFSGIKESLKQGLQEWMQQQGDEGAATELAAGDRLWRNADRNN